MADTPALAAEQSARSTANIRSSRTSMTNCSSDREQVRIRSSAQTETDAVKFNVVDPPTLAARADRAQPAAAADAAVLIAGAGRGRRAPRSALGKLTTTFRPRRGWKRRAGCR